MTPTIETPIAQTEGDTKPQTTSSQNTDHDTISANKSTQTDKPPSRRSTIRSTKPPSSKSPLEPEPESDPPKAPDKKENFDPHPIATIVSLSPPIYDARGHRYDDTEFRTELDEELEVPIERLRRRTGEEAWEAYFKDCKRETVDWPEALAGVGRY